MMTEETYDEYVEGLQVIVKRLRFLSLQLYMKMDWEKKSEGMKGVFKYRLEELGALEPEDE